MMKKSSFDQSIPYIFLGGLVGSILRFGVFTGLDDLVNHRSKLIVIKPNHVEGLLVSLLHYLPIGTLVVNLLGSFVLALLARC
ncbi:MAG: CrcB family protein, partial [Peptostreptococcus sp.]|nr:CrcB family protein [Peptostreptococcus sp.]